jgi:hypothetical protein
MFMLEALRVQVELGLSRRSFVSPIVQHLSSLITSVER